MTNKKRPGLSSTIIRLVLLATNIFGFMENLTALITFEARLAGKSVVKIIVLSLFAAVLISCSWFCLLAILSLYLVSLQWSWMSAMFVVLSLNIILLLIIAIILCKSKQHLFFPHTQQKCRNLFKS